MIRTLCLLGLVALAAPVHAQQPQLGEYEARGAQVGVAILTAHPRWKGKYRLRLDLRSGERIVLRGHTVPAGILFVFPPNHPGMVRGLDGVGAPALTHATVLVSRDLRLRARGSLTAPVRGRGKPGDTFPLSRRAGEWVELKVSGRPLWGHRDFLERTSGASSSTFLLGRRTALVAVEPDGSLRGTVRDGRTPVGPLVLQPKQAPATPAPTRKDGKVTFVAVDLTSDVDSRDFVRRARAFGLENLIDRVPARKDVAHPQLSLQAGVVSPYGRVIAKKMIDEEYGTPYVKEVSPFKQARAQANIRFVRSWLVQPGVRVSADGKRGQLVGEPGPGGAAVQGNPRFADFLFLSSHGYTDGEIRGAPTFADAPQAAPGQPRAHTPFDPLLLRVTNLPSGSRWTNGRTRWMMLALCNVVRREYWHDWAAALLDKQGVRGVLGYDSGSPKPGGTTIINRRFFAACQRGLSIVAAWRAANEEAKIFSWCAIVREDALGDKLSDWVRTGDLPTRKPKTRVLYFSAKRSERQGVPVASSADPTPKLKITWTTAGKSVSAENGRRGGGLVPGVKYRLELGGLPRAIEAEDKVLITFINIRENYWQGPTRHELDLQKMFAFEEGAIDRHDWAKKHQPTLPDTAILKGRTTLELTPRVGKDGIGSQVKVNEGYVWVQVSVRDGRNRLIARGSTMTNQLVLRAKGTNPFGEGLPLDIRTD